jgi:hypothetical protein
MSARQLHVWQADPGIRERLEERAGINVRIVGNPFFAVIEGARVILPVVTALNQWR